MNCSGGAGAIGRISPIAQCLYSAVRHAGCSDPGDWRHNALVTMALVVIASVLVYWGGMILNDVVDLEEDRTTRLHRPLVRGSISPVIAVISAMACYYCADTDLGCDNFVASATVVDGRCISVSDRSVAVRASV